MSTCRTLCVRPHYNTPPQNIPFSVIKQINTPNIIVNGIAAWKNLIIIMLLCLSKMLLYDLSSNDRLARIQPLLSLLSQVCVSRQVFYLLVLISLTTGVLLVRDILGMLVVMLLLNIQLLQMCFFILCQINIYVSFCVYVLKSIMLRVCAERPNFDLAPIQLPDPAFQVSVISSTTEIILSPVLFTPEELFKEFT